MTKTICASLLLQSVFWYQLQLHSQPEHTISTVESSALRWHRTVHVWLHHKNFNAYFSKSTVNSLFKSVCIYKVLVYQSSSANQIVLLYVKQKLEILGV